MIRHKKKHILILWITDRFGNFTKGKVYDAYATGRHIDGSGDYTNFYIVDSELDRYSLHKKEEGKFFIILEGEENE